MSQKVLWWVSVVVVLAAVLAPDVFGYYALTLMVLGLVERIHVSGCRCYNSDSLLRAGRTPAGDRRCGWGEGSPK
ncbi:MAG: hypothetical protein Ct9H300mP15_13350 [Gemmatimonadota bacterium]|nr:MAG: hypothetical protein Ct9H300mP15_13350 [Gemmatimonadota bacterium]